MRNSLNFCYVLALVFVLFSCKANDEKPSSTVEEDAAIQEMMDMERSKKQELSESDLRVIKAYEEDKTTITTNDIDLKDTTYTARLKKLYVNDNSERMAVVYGLKRPGRMGMALVQKEGGQPISLPQTSDAETSSTFSDGKNSLQNNGDVITLKIDGKTETYNLIK